MNRRRGAPSNTSYLFAGVGTDLPVDPDADRRVGRVASVAVLIGVAAAVIAGATLWLVLTDPVTVANALDGGEISPLIEQLAEVIYNALLGLLDYL